MNRSAFEGAVGSSTIHQGAWEESCPPLHQEIGRQTSVTAVDPAEAAELALASLSLSPGAPENSDLDDHSWMREPLMKFRFPEEKFQLHWSKKDTSLDAVEWVRQRVCLSPQHPSSKAVQLRAKNYPPNLSRGR